MNPGFQFSSERDGDAFKTLQTLMKYNNGYFKSAKQAKMILSGGVGYQWGRPENTPRFEVVYVNDKDVADAKKHFGVDAIAGKNIILQVWAIMSWAHYGRRSNRSVTWMYVLDDHGVVARYRLHYNEKTGVVAEKTEKDWVRDESISAPVFVEEPKIDKPVSDYVGMTGERRVFKGKIIKVINLGPSNYGYNQTSYLSIIIDDKGNKITYFNWLAEEGREVEFKATVKYHKEYNNEKQTVVSRAKLL